MNVLNIISSVSGYGKPHTVCCGYGKSYGHMLSELQFGAMGRLLCGVTFAEFGVKSESARQADPC